MLCDGFIDMPIDFAKNVRGQGHKFMHYKTSFKSGSFWIPGKVFFYAGTHKNNLDDLLWVVSEKN